MRSILQTLKPLCKIGLGLLMLLAGCGTDTWDRSYGPFLQPAYGVAEPPATNPDPSLRFADLTYEPASPVALGEEIVITATLNHPSPAIINVIASIGRGSGLPPPYTSTGLSIPLADNGQTPDAQAGDGIYTGQMVLPELIGARTSLPVIARVSWRSTATPPEITGEPLDIVLQVE